YLTEAGGQALAADVIAAAKAAGFNENTIQKARRRIKAKSERTGFGKGSYCTWILIDSIDSRSQKPGTYATYADSMGASGSRCDVCGYPLDPTNGDHGTHPLCDPEAAA